MLPIPALTDRYRVFQYLLTEVKVRAESPELGLNPGERQEIYGVEEENKNNTSSFVRLNI